MNSFKRDEQQLKLDPESDMTWSLLFKELWIINNNDCSNGRTQTLVKVPKKRKLFLCSYKICTLKYMIPKFQSAGVKIADFTKAENWAILLSKMVKGLGRVLCWIPSCDVTMVPKVCLLSFCSCRQKGL